MNRKLSIAVTVHYADGSEMESTNSVSNFESALEL